MVFGLHIGWWAKTWARWMKELELVAILWGNWHYGTCQFQQLCRRLSSLEHKWFKGWVFTWLIRKWFDGAEKAFGYYTDNENNGINGWHTYTLIWDANHMEWQLDGKTYLSQSITSNNAYCFQKEQVFLI